ncbi:MAG TPA: YggS family pyridoxal phosphate-dependent enzyme [Caldilineaceae bacterium]|nr:YggS family pyridoxal phosphate-dependent enzyme [Caldilineaceae bacterium]
MSTELSAQAIVDNLAAVHQQIEQSAKRAGRDPAEITLVAVSKTKPMAAIEAAYAAGQRDFGENRLEELWEKVEAAQRLGLEEIRWHMIGTIQSRKTNLVIGPFALIHSVDRLKIAQRLSRDATAAECVLSVLLEVNVSGEESKHGFTAESVRACAAELFALPALQIKGLMTMAPFVADAEETRPVFQALRQLRDALHAQQPSARLPHLSMGMTNDFPIAIEEGATLVRVGSAIFGSRTP